MEDLWRSRRPPQALDLDALRMPAYGDGGDQPAAIEAGVPATASSACKELGLSDAHSVWNDQQNAAVFLRAVALFLDGRSHELGSAQVHVSRSTRTYLPVCVSHCIMFFMSLLAMQFDKDDLLAVELVTAAANLRATCFGISRQSLFETKVWKPLGLSCCMCFGCGL